MGVVVVNKILECGPQNLRKRVLEEVTRIVIHRCSIATNAVEMSNVFKGIPETGGWMPYHFVILKDGTTEQALPVDRIAYHALQYNRGSIGVAVIGDHRTDHPTAEQTKSLIEFCADWMDWIITDVDGHTDIPHATHDPSKDCPGKNLNVWDIYKEAVQLKAMRAGDRVRAMGCILDSSEYLSTPGSH